MNNTSILAKNAAEQYLQYARTHKRASWPSFASCKAATPPSSPPWPTNDRPPPAASCAWNAANGAPCLCSITAKAAPGPRSPPCCTTPAASSCASTTTPSPPWTPPGERGQRLPTGGGAVLVLYYKEWAHAR